MQFSASYDISYTLGKAIPLFDSNGNKLDRKLIYDKIAELVFLYGERYQDALIKGVFMNIYYISENGYIPKDFNYPKYKDMIDNLFNVMSSDLISDNLPEVKSLLFKKGRIHSKITTLKRTNIDKCRAFIVADIETVMVNNVHVPYAAGCLLVKPGDDLTSSNSIEIFFSENYIPLYPSFEDRSSKMLFNFLSYLESCVQKHDGVRTICFHNLSRFDGIIILKYYANRGDSYKIKPLLRNHMIYELKVYINYSVLGIL